MPIRTELPKLALAALLLAGSTLHAAPPPEENAQPPPAPAAPAEPQPQSASPAAEPQPAPPAGGPGAADVRAKAQEYRSAAVQFHKPAGPVTVTADRAEWQQAGTMHYTGNVQLKVDTLELRGESLELRQFDDGSYQAHLTGEPAQLADTGSEGAPPINAQARKLDYDARSAIVELTGGAVLTRGADKLTGENIRYDLGARRVQAQGGNGGQVRIVIQPTPGGPAQKPAPAAPPASAPAQPESGQPPAQPEPEPPP